MLNQIVHETAGVSEVIERAQDAISFLSGRKVSLMIIVLNEAAEDEKLRKRDIILRQIILDVCEVESWERLISKDRKRELVIGRQLYCYYAKQILGSSLKTIGKAVGGRDHTTAIHSIQTIKDLVWQKDADILDSMKHIEDKIKINIYEDQAHTNAIPDTV
jgi:chromosomal replication initiation ATPase DnaA